MILLFFHKNLCCDHSLEPTCRQGFNPIALRQAKIMNNLGLSECSRVNAGSQHIFGSEVRKISLNYPCYPFLFGTLLWFFYLEDYSKIHFFSLVF